MAYGNDVGNEAGTIGGVSVNQNGAHGMAGQAPHMTRIVYHGADGRRCSVGLSDVQLNGLINDNDMRAAQRQNPRITREGLAGVLLDQQLEHERKNGMHSGTPLNTLALVSQTLHHKMAGVQRDNAIASAVSHNKHNLSEYAVASQAQSNFIQARQNDNHQTHDHAAEMRGQAVLYRSGMKH